MSVSLCDIDCSNCTYIINCAGCKNTDGKPFGKDCIVANCCKTRKFPNCSECDKGDCAIKKQLINEINALGIKNMPEVTELYSLKGSFVNLEFPLPGGNTVKFWDDDKIYLGCQLEKTSPSDKCFGICADENFILVCEYGENGINPEIVLFKRR